RPDKGEILYGGKPITQQRRASFGYMPEVSKLPEMLTPAEVLRHHLAMFNPKWLARNKRKDEIERTLKKVGLWEARHKKVKKLSKGMGRRLAWAQATIHDPEFVILDEPFSGL